VAEYTLRRRCQERLLALRDQRYGWWNHWRELADYVLPRRYQWLLTPNEVTRGGQINQRIIDSTGTIAARTCASGMMAGITSPSRPWFKLRIPDTAASTDQSGPVARWLAECERRMMRVFSESNFYNSMGVLFLDLTVFGSACALIYEDYDNVICCYNPALGEFYFDNSPQLKIDTVYREFKYTVAQAEARWGRERLSITSQRDLDTPAGRQRQILIGHALEPNVGDSPVPKRFRWRDVYWEVASGEIEGTLGERGFNEFPALGARWDLAGDDVYGRSPGMDALGDIKQLQQETKRKAQAIDKMVNPPLLADVQLKNQPASTLPGGVTYVNNLRETSGMRPIYQVAPPVQELMQDITEIQRRIQRIFFNDLFMMFEQLQAEPRSAAAVDVRREEKMTMLGPVIERLQNEVLDPAIDRVFGIMQRGGLLPDPPQEIAGQFIKVEYVSMMAEAQKAAGTAGIERILGLAGNLAGVDPSAMDVIDVKETMQEYAMLLSVNPNVIRSDNEVLAIRAERAKAQQAQQEQQASLAYTQAAKNLSQTELGGGINAAQLLANGGTA
jgi:hypothetical protein